LSPYIKAPIFSPCPFITTIHDLLFLITPHYTGWRYKLYNELFKIFGRIISKRAASIITDSEHSKRDVIKIFGIPDKKVHVIFLGISKEYMVIGEVDLIKEVKRVYGIEGKYILYIGNFKPHKNVKRLIEAFADVKDEFLDLKLVLGGKKDKYVHLLKDTAEKLGIMDKVIFTDFIKDEDLPYLYSGAELFVYPSLYEGFGLPVLEAMACGTPVICSNTTSLPEVVGDSGILIDTKDAKNITSAILTLLKNDKQKEILIKKGLERAKGFATDRYSSKILSLIESI
jgi:glycosyltransferase involved in cell wall biosynthesis